MYPYLGQGTTDNANLKNPGSPIMPALMPPGSTVQDYINSQGGTPMVQGGYILNDNTIPAAADFDTLLMPAKDTSDVVWWSYYDSVAIPSAAAKNGSLFLNPNNAAGPWFSNLANSGRLQGDERMLVTGIRVEIWNDVTTNPTNLVTVKEILRQAYFEFWLQNKPYTSHNGFQFLESLTNIAVNTNYYGLRPYIGITLPLRIPIAKNITFQLKYNLGTTPSLSGNWYMYAYIIGPLYRGVQ